eukprot:364639-Chlamydomonas_euryale.AAC.30
MPDATRRGANATLWATARRAPHARQPPPVPVPFPSPPPVSPRSAERTPSSCSAAVACFHGARRCDRAAGRAGRRGGRPEDGSANASETSERGPGRTHVQAGDTRRALRTGPLHSLTLTCMQGREKGVADGNSHPHIHACKEEKAGFNRSCQMDQHPHHRRAVRGPLVAPLTCARSRTGSAWDGRGVDARTAPAIVRRLWTVKHPRTQPHMISRIRAGWCPPVPRACVSPPHTATPHVPRASVPIVLDFRLLPLKAAQGLPRTRPSTAAGQKRVADRTRTRRPTLSQPRSVALARVFRHKRVRGSCRAAAWLDP